MLNSKALINYTGLFVASCIYFQFCLCKEYQKFKKEVLFNMDA